MPCGGRRLVLCATSLHLVGWTVPDRAAHILCRGYLGLYPTLTERVVPRQRTESLVKTMR
jgi:hypothetical protein